MKSRSWKTTLGGLLALIGANLALFWPEHCAKLGGFLAALGSGVGLLFARDNNKTSAQVGAGGPGAANRVPIQKLGVSLVAGGLLAAGLVGVGVAGSGCALFRPDSTQGEKARVVEGLCYSAASIGTTAALEQNPDWRPDFLAAYETLQITLTRGMISGALLREIVASLPVKELKSPTARVAVESATMLFDTVTGRPYSLEEAPLLKAAAEGIRNGMKVGLAATQKVKAK